MSFEQSLEKLFKSSGQINIYFEHDDIVLLNKLVSEPNIESIIIYKETYEILKDDISSIEKIWKTDLNIDDINRLGLSKMLKNYFVFIKNSNIEDVFRTDASNPNMKTPIMFQESFSVCVLDSNSPKKITDKFNDKNKTVFKKVYGIVNENFKFYNDIVYSNTNYKVEGKMQSLTSGRIYVIIKKRSEKLEKKGETFSGTYLSSKSPEKIAVKYREYVEKVVNQESKPVKEVKKVETTQKRETNYEYFNVHATIPKLSNDAINSYDSKKYKQVLELFLRNLLVKLIPDSEVDDRQTIITTLLDEGTIDRYWMPCFTHKSKDPNVGSNYETFEALGDKLMSYCFKSYLYKRYPTISESQLNDLDTKVNSKEFQGMIGKTIGFWDYLIHDGIDDTIPSIHEDLLESFCGCLDTILNDKLCIGIGSIIIYNMYSILLAQTDFDIESTDCQKDSINPKTWITQLFEILGKKKNDKTITISKPISFNSRQNEWNMLTQKLRDIVEAEDIELNIKGQKVSTFGFQEISEQYQEGFRVQILLLEQGMNELRNLVAKYNLPIDLDSSRLFIKNNILGESFANVKLVAANRAYAQAKNSLEKIGFTKDVVLGLKYKIKIQRALNGDLDKENMLYSKVVEQLRASGKKLKHVIVCDVWESIDWKLVQLIAIDMNNRQTILETYKSKASEKQDIYKRLIDKYLSN